MGQIATKEQERKALAQIIEIVEGLGEGSYIGTAFEGCWEIAKSNIENDFACSMRQRVEYEQEQVKEAKETIKYRDAELADKHKEVMELRKIVETLTASNIDLTEKCKKAEKETEEFITKAAELEAKNEQLESEVIKLKARLYDLLYTERGDS